MPAPITNQLPHGIVTLVAADCLIIYATSPRNNQIDTEFLNCFDVLGADT